MTLAEALDQWLLARERLADADDGNEDIRQLELSSQRRWWRRYEEENVDAYPSGPPAAR